MTRRIAFTNHKGGVGKTTSAINLSAAMAAFYSKRCLLIDFDPQGNASTGLGITPGGLGEKLFADILVGTTRKSGPPPGFKDCIIETSLPGLYLVPADKRLAMLNPNEPWKLKTVLDHQPDLKFDFVFIDTPPGIGPMMTNALVAADWTIIPCEYAIFSLNGLADMLEAIEGSALFSDKTGISDPFRILFNKVDRRKKRSATYAKGETEGLKNQIFKTVIHDNDNLNQAQSEGVSIFSYDTACDGAKDYYELAAEVLEYEKTRLKAAEQVNE